MRKLSLFLFFLPIILLGADWTQEEICGYSSSYAPSLDVTFNSQSQPHVVFSAGSTFFHVSKEGASWGSKTDLSTGKSQQSPKIFTDSYDYVHIYTKQSDGTFLHNYRGSGGTWSSSTLSTPTPLDGFDVSMRILRYASGIPMMGSYYYVTYFVFQSGNTIYHSFFRDTNTSELSSFRETIGTVSFTLAGGGVRFAEKNKQSVILLKKNTSDYGYYALTGEESGSVGAVVPGKPTSYAWSDVTKIYSSTTKPWGGNVGLDDDLIPYACLYTSSTVTQSDAKVYSLKEGKWESLSSKSGGYETTMDSQTGTTAWLKGGKIYVMYKKDDKLFVAEGFTPEASPYRIAVARKGDIVIVIYVSLTTKKLYSASRDLSE